MTFDIDAFAETELAPACWTTGMDALFRARSDMRGLRIVDPEDLLDFPNAVPNAKGWRFVSDRRAAGLSMRPPVRGTWRRSPRRRNAVPARHHANRGMRGALG